MALLLGMLVWVHLLNVLESDFLEVRCHFNLKRKLRVQKLQKLLVTILLYFLQLIEIFANHIVVFLIFGGLTLLLLLKKLVSNFLQMFRGQLIPCFFCHIFGVQTIGQ